MEFLESFGVAGCSFPCLYNLDMGRVFWIEGNGRIRPFRLLEEAQKRARIFLTIGRKYVDSLNRSGCCGICHNDSGSNGEVSGMDSGAFTLRG